MTSTPPLVGRDEEFAALTERAAAGSSTVLAGDAGVGKSRLADELADVARDAGRHIVTVRATESGARLALAAFAPHMPASDLGITVEPGSELAGLQRSLLDAAQGKPLTLHVDDAHNLDPSSAIVVLQMAPRPDVAVLATVRSRHSLPAEVAALWKEGLARRVTVHSLDRGASDALVTALLGGFVPVGVLDEIWRLARGNPLYTSELLAGGVESGALSEAAEGWKISPDAVLPEQLLDTVGARFVHMGQEVRDAAVAVALAEPLALDIGIEIGGDEAIAALEDDGVLVAEGQGQHARLRFTHPLYAELLIVSAGEGHRRKLRRRLADLLGARGSAPAVLMQRARLYLDAGEADASLFEAAASEALRRGDAESATEFCHAALAGGDSLPARTVLALARGALGRHDEAHGMLLDIAGEAPDEGMLAIVTLAHVQLLGVGVGRASDALGLLSERAEQVTDPFWRQALTAKRGALLFQLERARDALAVLEPVLAADQVSPARVEALLWAAVSAVTIGDVARAARLSDEAIDLVTTQPWLAMGNDAFVVVAAVTIRVSTMLLQGEIADAASYAEAACRRCDAISAMQAECTTATAHFLRGHLRPALESLRKHAGAAMRLPQSLERAFVWVLHAGAEATAGNAEDARRLLALVDMEGAESRAAFEWWYERAQVLAMAASGSVAAAVSYTIAIAESHPEDPGRRAVSLHDAVRMGAAGDVVELLVDNAKRPEASWFERVAGEHALAAVVEDGTALEEVSQAFEDGGIDLYGAEAALQAARAFAADGLRFRAQECRTRAQVLMERCGPVQMFLGGSVAELTARESEIVKLAADRLSDKEIAAQLGVSVRTVGNHLQRAYRKLGVGGRRDLEGLVLRCLDS